MSSKPRLLLESAKKTVWYETRRVVVPECEASSTKLVLEDASSDAREELAVETVAKEEWKVVWALLVSFEEATAAVPELFLVAVAINFLIFAEVEDDRPLALVPFSLDLLLVTGVMKKDAGIVVLCFNQYRRGRCE